MSFCLLFIHREVEERYSVAVSLFLRYPISNSDRSPRCGSAIAVAVGIAVCAAAPSGWLARMAGSPQRILIVAVGTSSLGEAQTRHHTVDRSVMQARRRVRDHGQAQFAGGGRGKVAADDTD